jgi:hypothetical protein
MTRRRPCPVAPGPLEGYAARFDDLFGSLAQRRGFREYLAGLLAPRERNKTLTALAGAEPVTGAQHRSVQRLQFFLSESRWDPEQVNSRRMELLLADPATAPHGGGVLVIDDSGDRKDGTKTAHVGHQWLGRYGKTDNGVVTVTTVWADERLYYPVHAVPYTPARHFPKGKNDPAFRTKLQIGADLAVRAQDAGRSSPAAAPGPTARTRTPRSTRPATWPGTGQRIPATGTRSPAPSATGTPRPGSRPTRRWAGGGPTAPGGWWQPPPTRPPCRPRPPGTWSPTCPAPAARARPKAPTRPRPWPRSCGSTASATGSSKVTSRSKTSWAGPTSKSAPIPPSAATRPWSTARSAFAGPPGSLISHRTRRSHRGRPPSAERGGPGLPLQPPAPSWPRALRAIRAWLSPWIGLQRWWQAWSKAPPPPQLQALINSVGTGCGLHLYIPN